MQEAELEIKFISFAAKEGFLIRKMLGSSPDLILEKEGKKIAVELKGSRKTTVLPVALGQLMFAKAKLGTEELWLVTSRHPVSFKREWIDFFFELGIKIWFFDESKGFILVTPEKLQELMHDYTRISSPEKL